MKTTENKTAQHPQAKHRSDSEKGPCAKRGCPPRPRLSITRSALNESLTALTTRAPEAGGLLLGPIGSDDITAFYLDDGARCTGATYSPDHIALNRLMKTRWLPEGIDMKGFIHSHPGRFDHLSAGDLEYIGRLLKSNEDMDVFAAPIVIPQEFRLCPFVVFRDDPLTPQMAEVVVL